MAFSFDEVMNLQSFEFSISDVIPRMHKTFHTWFSLHIFVNFMKKEPSTKFYFIFEYFSRTYEIIIFWKSKMHLYVNAPSMPMNTHDMLIVAYLQTYRIFTKRHFVLWWKRIILNKSCYFGLSSPLNFLQRRCFSVSFDFFDYQFEREHFP